MVKDLKAVIKSKKAKQALPDGGHKEEHQHVENEARESRGHWKHPLDFLFSCISVSVGLGSKYIHIQYLEDGYKLFGLAQKFAINKKSTIVVQSL